MAPRTDKRNTYVDPRNGELADAVEVRDWAKVEALALDGVRGAPSMGADAAAWAMLAMTARLHARMDARDARKAGGADADVR